MAEASHSPVPPVQINEPEVNQWISGLIALFAAVLALIAYFVTPGSPRAAAIAFAVLTIFGIAANRIFGKLRGSIAITTALVVAVAAGSFGAAIVWEVKSVSGTAAPPEIKISDPRGGAQLGPHPVITGYVSHLAPNEVVWSFSEPYTSDKNPILSGKIYPDIGPCLVSGRSFRCNLVYVGGRDYYCKQILLIVAIVNSSQANADANINVESIGHSDDYISAIEDGAPSHISNAIRYVRVHRGPGSKRC
jgi:hypothetical protein